MFLWSEEQIRFLRDASEAVPFNDTLAARIAPLIPQGARVCDAGCGLGYLSLALAPYCARVTAVDRAPEALAVLRENALARKISNIELCEGDAFALPAEMRFALMTFCFFGGVEETLACVKRHCTGKAVLFKKNWTTHRFTLRSVALEKFTFETTCRALDALNVPYESVSFPLEMGQPFRSLADAAAFFRLHSREMRPGPITEADIASRLTRTDSSEFPYYLPSNRPVGMITVDAGAIPDAII